MSFALVFITAFFLLVLLVSLWKTYHLKSLLHPGFWFGILWIIGVLSYYVINTFDNKFNTIYPEYVDELNGYILFSALSFLTLQNIGRRKILHSFSKWDVEPFFKVYKYLSIAAFVASMLMFIVQGAIFSFGANRDAVGNANMLHAMGKYEVSPLYVFLNTFISLNIFLAIYAGFRLSEDFRNKGKINHKFLLLLPILTQIIHMIMLGGRVDFITGMRFYVFGIVISISNGINGKTFKKLIRTGLIVILIFGIYSTINLELRLKYANSYVNPSRSVSWDDYPLLKPFAGIIEYYSCSYMGYQLRRNDTTTQELEYGSRTFGGILFFDVPLSNLLGLKNATIGNLLGIKRHSLLDQWANSINNDLPWATTTTSSYLFLYDDFGYYGTYIILLLMVLITQLLFVSWFGKPHKTFISFYLLLLFYVFWNNSIFDPIFAGGAIKGYLLSILFLDIICIYKKKLNR
jgi:oligosaccharide repeat unit polymerase